MNLRSRAPGWLAALPRLAALYLWLSNRDETGHIVRFWSLGLVSSSVVAIGLVWVYRTTAAAALNDLRQHTLMVAVLAGVVTAVVVSHQRNVHAARATRSWLAALPMGSRARRVEDLVLQLGPVIATLILISVLGLFAGTIFSVAGLYADACIIVWGSLLVGALLGAAGGLAFPPPKAVIPYPGSRYVPHRVARGRRPVPSLAALGIWPIRRMFAMLRPKTLSRTLLPLLLMMPMGTNAAAAMIIIALLITLTAFVCLVMSVSWVNRAARQWLNPLPITSRRLGRIVAARALIAAVGICAASAWLIWVGGS